MPRLSQGQETGVTQLLDARAGTWTPNTEVDGRAMAGARDVGEVGRAIRGAAARERLASTFFFPTTAARNRVWIVGEGHPRRLPAT